MNEKTPIVIIGTSLGPDSDGVVRTGLAAASAMGATPLLVHACEGKTVHFMDPAETRGSFAAADSRLDLAKVHEQGRRLGIAPRNVWMRPGTADRILSEDVATQKADLLVVGSRFGASGRWPQVGSTVDRLLSTIDCPLLIVQPDAPFPPRKALAPVDLSDISAGGLRCGLPLLERWGVAAEAIELLFVVEPRSGPSQFAPADVARFAAEELERFTVVHGGTRSAALRRRVRVGKPSEESIAEAGAEHHDLLLLSTRCRSGWKRWLGGSFASAVAQRVAGNVLVVPPGAALAAVGDKAVGADWEYVADEQPR